MFKYLVLVLIICLSRALIDKQLQEKGSGITYEEQEKIINILRNYSKAANHSMGGIQALQCAQSWAFHWSLNDQLGGDWDAVDTTYQISVQAYTIQQKWVIYRNFEQKGCNYVIWKTRGIKLNENPNFYNIGDRIGDGITSFELSKSMEAINDALRLEASDMVQNSKFIKAKLQYYFGDYWSVAIYINGNGWMLAVEEKWFSLQNYGRWGWNYRIWKSYHD